MQPPSQDDVVTGWFRRLRARIRYRRFDADLRHEIDAHRAMAEDALRQTGATTADAQRESARVLGNITLARETARGVWIAPWLESVWQDVRYAARGLRKAPLFAGTVLAILTIAMGLDTTLFTTVDAVLLRPWHVADPDRVAVVFRLVQDNQGRIGRDGASAVEYRYLRDHARTIDLFAMRQGRVRIGADPSSPLRRMRSVSANYFRALKIPLVAGRGFTSDEDDVNRPEAVAVISDALWEEQLNRAPLRDQILLFENIPFSVIGVAARGAMDSPINGIPAVWIPLAATSLLSPLVPQARDFLLSPRTCCVDMAGRLAAGASDADAQAELSVLARQFDSPDAKNDVGVAVTSTAAVNDRRIGNFLPVFLFLAAGLLLLLLLACANVGNLQLARALARRREIAIRLSLGASRRRVIRQLLVEGLVLAASAGVISVALASFLPHVILQNVDADYFAAFNLSLDASVLVFVFVLAALTCVLFGLAPALRSTRGALANRQGPVERTRLRSSLLTIQVALSTVLLVGASLLTRGVTRAATFDPGFDVQNTEVLSVTLPTNAYDRVQMRTFGRAVLDAAAAARIGPVGATFNVPLDNSRMTVEVGLPGEPESANRVVSVVTVSPGYFGALGIPLKDGELFTEDDPNADFVINETLARTLWPNGSAVGQRFSYANGRVVGVVADAHTESLDHILPTIFQRTTSAGSFLFRDGPDAGARLRTIVATLEPRAVTTVTPLRDGLSEYLKPSVIGAWLGAAIGGLALILAAVGTFGVFSFVVGERTREIGIRLAIGARGRHVVSLLSRRLVGPLGAGFAAGLLVSLLAGRVLADQLFGLNPRDPIAYAAVSALVLAAAIAAAFAPIRRALRVDPAVTLRHE